MKKSVKRILCGVLSCLMGSSLIAESALRLNADEPALGKTTSASVSFSEVKGEFDASALRNNYFNDNVLKAEDTAPTYETRTVMVTLSGEPLVDRSENRAVTEYIGSWSGEVAKSQIQTEQTAFLQALTQKGIPYSVKRSYNTVLNGVAIEVNTKYVSDIKKMKGVDSVVITTAYAEPKTSESIVHNVVTNKTDVYETGIYNSSAYAATYGEGTVVAVLDTGLDYTHSAFQRFKSEDVDYAWDREYIKSVIDNKHLVAEGRSGSLEAADVYISEKVPYAYDYADDDPDVYPSYSNHGTHVAGIIGGYDPAGYTDKDGNPIKDKEFLGVVPDAQLVICKVFTDDLDDPDLGGAVAEDIVAALEDCVTLGVDVINMSLGTSCGFTTTDDGDDEGEMLNDVYTRVMDSGISLICAASNDYSAGYGGVYGTNLASNPDAGTVGSPSTYAGALSVASINGQKASYLVVPGETEEQNNYVFFEEARDINSNPLDFVKGLCGSTASGEFEYVVVPGVGKAADYTSTVKRLFKEKDRIALVKRGDNTFQEKVEIAMEMGAIGVIVYNNVAGTIRMNLGEVENPVPSVSISMNAGTAMVEKAKGRVGKFQLNEKFAAGPFMSEFSSWGPTHDLKMKPEITAHGGEITSAVPGGYGEQSGTSMATPNMAGFMAIVRSYIKKDLADVVDINDASAVNRLAMQLTMSTAGTVYDQDNLPYSPRKQGAGVAKLENVVGGTKAYLSTDVARNDYRPKYELFDDPDRTGEYVVKFNLTNFGDSTLSFKPTHEFMTETLSSDKLTVSEKAYMLEKSTAAWSVDGKAISESETISVGAKQTKKITVVFTLDEADRHYIEESFENGMYVEGFAKLTSETKGQCDLSIPFMGFYGDWDDAPMLDYSAYEVSTNAQDASVLEEDKIKASVWETQPFSLYYNEKYILPMGEYLYRLPDDAEPMYISEEYNSVSCYNEYYGEGHDENYMTSTGIKAVYAGLLRNARVVKYKLYDESTGEVILSDTINRVGKAYSGGGSAVPANVEFELRPETEGMKANGKYKMTFEFFKDEPLDGERAREEDTFEFTFTLDYEAPVLEDARVRYYNYKDGNKEKQRIYLDLDIYDNHYAQTVMLCYPKVGADGDLELQLATEYPTPVRNAVRNGVTSLSIEITDIYEQYGNQLYLMIDDYSVNSCQYRLNIEECNASILPDGFELGKDEENVTVDIYGTHKTAVLFGENYAGEADRSNLLWSSANTQVAAVKNGEIVGLRAGTTKIFVSNRKGVSKTINVTVTNNVSKELPNIPTLNFGLIQTASGSLSKASGFIEVNAGETINMTVEATPWYHPMTDLRLKWTSSNPAVATVTDSGVVTTIKKGTVVITATVQQRDGDGWADTLYSATSIMQVQNEFTVSNFTLTDYNGLGYTVDKDLGLTEEDGVLVIPTDLNVMYIGEEAFKDNNNIKKIVIPETVMDIQPRAFLNCTALEEVYFVSMQERDYDNEPAKADVSMIYEQAFEGCINLKKIDFSHVKTVTVAEDCFKGCSQLATVIDMPSIGTMHHRAFAGTALKSVDLTGLHMSGKEVFANCTQLVKITTGRFTAIGEGMFKGCTGLRNEVQIHTPKIGEGAFSGCINLPGVVISSPDGYALEFDIGARAFENCGSNARGNFYIDYGTEIIRSIGTRAFSGSSLTTLEPIYGLEILGENAFANTDLTTIYLSDSLDIASLRISGVPFNGLTVTLAQGTTKYVEESGVIYNAGKSELLYVNASVTGAFTVPVGVKRIGSYAFAESKVSAVVLPSSVSELGVGVFKNAKLQTIDIASSAITAIPESAFEGSSLTAITLSNRVTEIGARAFAKSAIAAFKADGLQTIGNNAFEGCNALVEIVLADGISSMGDKVFANCQALTDVTLPSLKELGKQTFDSCNNLTTVVFGENAAVTGTYTFIRLPKLTSVTLGKETTSIGIGAFAYCKELKTVTLPEKVAIVEAEAFAECTALTNVNGLENVENFGYGAFYNVSLTELNLAAAKNVGEMAFAYVTNRKPTYTKIEIPVVETIGAYAFFNGGESKLELPATLKEVGEAAFASSDNLATVVVASANTSFFVEDSVLYRYTNEEKNRYELVSYPTARVEAGEKGERTYAVKEGTVRVKESAFYALNKDAVNAVVLPYSINTIGDSAFFESGIVEYTFESIKAPALETIYRYEIQMEIESQQNSAYYKGYYYTNFATYILYYTSYGTEKSPLVMNYPANGVGYDNHIYTTYFGTRNASEKDLIEDGTRTFLEMVEEMPEASEVAAWAELDKTAENKAMVEEFAATMKTARIYYNNATDQEGQLPFITKSAEDKLFAVEEALRAVKVAFEIPFIVDELRVADDATYKTEYLVGEKFNMEGLSLIVVYDDYSTEVADASKFELLTTGELASYHKYVEVRYEGVKVRVPITVVEEGGGDSSSDGDSTNSAPESGDSDNSVVAGKPEGGCGCGSVIGFGEGQDMGTAVMLLALLTVAGITVVVKAVKAKKNTDNE